MMHTSYALDVIISYITDNTMLVTAPPFELCTTENLLISVLCVICGSHKIMLVSFNMSNPPLQHHL